MGLFDSIVGKVKSYENECNNGYDYMNSRCSNMSDEDLKEQFKRTKNDMSEAISLEAKSKKCAELKAVGDELKRRGYMTSEN